jgi:hypothetical protein
MIGTMSPLPESSVTALVDGEVATTHSMGSQPEEGMGTNKVASGSVII